ncbi:MAG: hypothetical protein ACRBEE_05660 [Arenicella sp.]
MASSLSQSRMSLLHFESPRAQEEVQNFLYKIDVTFPKNNGLGEDFWSEVNVRETSSSQPLKNTSDLTDNVVYIKHMFDQCLSINLDRVHFEAAYKMIGGGAIDFAACPTAYLSVIVGACWLHLHGIASHLMYLNDELSVYRARSFHALFESMQIENAVIAPTMDLAQRSHAYQKPVTFCSVRELGLDYLRMHVEQGKEDLENEPVTPSLLPSQSRAQHRPEPLAVVLMEDIGLIMVDSMMTPLQISSESYATEEVTTSQDQDESVIAVSSFNKVFHKLPRIGGVSASLDQYTQHDLQRYGVDQHSLEVFRPTSHDTMRFFNQEKNRFEALVKQIMLTAEQAAAEQTAQVCLIDQVSPKMSEHIGQLMSATTENIRVMSLPMEEVLAFFQSNEKLPQQGTLCVLVEGSLTNIPDVTEQYHRVQGVDVAVFSMGIEKSLRMSQRRSAVIAGVFNCPCSMSFLSIEHFDSDKSSLPSRCLNKLPEGWNQSLLPHIARALQKQHDRKRRSSNNALLIYEQETDDLLAFSG